MTTETLRCICGREVGIVRLNPETLTFGHRVNPGLAAHPVRLARTGQEPRTPEHYSARSSSHPAPSEGPATRREDAPNAGPSHPRPVRARRVDRVASPPLGHPSAPRPERLGLRSTPGEQA